MSRALQNELRLVREGAAKIPTGTQAYARALEIVGELRAALEDGPAQLEPWRAIALVRQCREKIDALVNNPDA